MPMINLRRIASPIHVDDVGVLPFDYNEVLLLFEPMTRAGRSVADITGLTGLLTYTTPGCGKSIPLLTSDYSWLLHQPGSEFYKYGMQVDTTHEGFRQAVCMTTGIRYVTDIQFFRSRRGDLFIRCRIFGKQQEAVHVGRWDARSLDEENDVSCYEMAAKYYEDSLWDIACRMVVKGISERMIREEYNG